MILQSAGAAKDTIGALNTTSNEGPSDRDGRVVISVQEGFFLGCFPIPDDYIYGADVYQLVWSSLGVFNRPGDIFDLGSCFMVAPGFVATASHNIDFAKRKLEEYGVRHPTDELRLNLGVVERSTGLSMQVHRSIQLNGSEITLLQVGRHYSQEEYPLPSPLVLRTSRLRADEPLTLVGFANQDVVFDPDVSVSRGEDAVHIEAQVIMGTGFVMDEENAFLIHDSSVKIGDIEAMPRMSGGPVFDEAGRVVGLISRSFENGGYSIVTRWSAAFSMDQFPREYVGTVTIGESSETVFNFIVHNAD